MKTSISYQCLLLINLLNLSQFALAEPHKPVWKADATSEFEVGTQLRPWTMRDEGMEYILENCRSMCGINNIYLVAVMHREHRPYQAPKFPHNPKRATFQAEDSVVSWFPEMERYGKIKPAFSKYDWILNTDWLKLLVQECRKHNMVVGAEVSHYPIPLEMLKQHPEWLMQDVNGNSPNNRQFCLHNPDVRAYLIALFGDLAANYDIDYLQTCQFVYDNRDIDNGGGCFCTHCIATASEQGVDLEAIRIALKKDKKTQPARSQWQQFRFDSVTRLYQQLAQTIRKENPTCRLRLNDVYSWRRNDPRKRGIDIGAISEHLGSIVNQDHDEQLGAERADFEARAKWLATNRKHLGYEKPLISGIAPRIEATPELVKEGIRVAVQHPAKVNGLAFKHYDGASFGLMRAFKQGMIDAGVQGLTPTLGWEVEAMKLDGYVPFEQELAEDWGVATQGTGRATGTFDLPSGSYDVRITYFDSPGGRSKVTLQVAGTERATFVMNEDVDCWRWRLFKGIQIKQGDTITLIGQADKKEQAKLDFIEFMKR